MDNSKIKGEKMAKVTWKGWREEPEEDCKVAYEFLTGQRTKPIVVVFGIPKSHKKKLSSKELTTSTNLQNEEEHE